MSDALTFVFSSALMVFGLSYLINAGTWLKVIRQLTSQGPQIALWAVLLLITGLSLISVHNHWAMNWAVVITVFGWAMAIKGAVLLLFPNTAMRFINWTDDAYLKIMRIAGAVYFLLGLAIYLEMRGVI